MAIRSQYILLPAKLGIAFHHAPVIGFEIVPDVGEAVDMAVYRPAFSAFFASSAAIQAFAPMLPTVRVINRYPSSADLAGAFPLVYQAFFTAHGALMQTWLLLGRGRRPIVRDSGFSANGAHDEVFVILARFPDMGIVPLQAAFAAPASMPVVV